MSNFHWVELWKWYSFSFFLKKIKIRHWNVASVFVVCYMFCAFVVYSVSLRQQLQDGWKKLVGAQHYNKDGCVNNR